MLTSITRILAGKFRIDEELLTAGATLQDLELDSLDVVEFALAIEKDLGAKVTDDELLRLQSLGSIAAHVEQRIAAGSVAADAR
jgi:acyl carrier protein